MDTANQRVRWAEICIGLYWTITAALLISNNPSQASLRQALTQLALTAGLFALSNWCEKDKTRRSKFLWGSWPLLLMWTYKSIDSVQIALGLPLHDAQLQAWDQALWGCSPALEWSIHWEWFWFSEFLHFCYATYMLNFAMLITRQIKVRGQDFARIALGGGVCGLISGYCGNCLFPALGPRHLLPPLAESLQGPFWRLCHFLSKDGAAAAAAFPSGHCALSTATAVIAWKLDRRLFPVYAIWSVGTVCSTVYGRFHYSLDSIVGVFLGGVSALVVLKIYDHLISLRR